MFETGSCFTLSPNKSNFLVLKSPFPNPNIIHIGSKQLSINADYTQIVFSVLHIWILLDTLSLHNTHTLKDVFFNSHLLRGLNQTTIKTQRKYKILYIVQIQYLFKTRALHAKNSSVLMLCEVDEF